MFKYTLLWVKKALSLRPSGTNPNLSLLKRTETEISKHCSYFIILPYFQEEHVNIAALLLACSGRNGCPPRLSFTAQ